ncbi:S-layer homology domain-containing protein [Propionispora hippei]|uniref:S-layer homology domain-containing protein n=1 Tax=Propionispora hippei DSM 15287 TaxID=1123003 RepID=A0A1M6K8B1_9FIRM|nr:S-layer homology domain-containing protein [Propionispora hippei]SHJ55212.1 S-layer homology domain-containing protein [Propionispora hippei DSM 15287]
MKKKLAVALALMFVTTTAGTVFAAENNPFSSIPTNHWAYQSVNKLVKAGLIDGYGDGDFRGDKPITRYEMASLVAKAMSNEEKADAGLKSELTKLESEFSGELQNLGVRVTTLEKNQPNFKMNGTFDTRYTAKKTEDGASDVKGEYRLRLNGEAKVDSKTSFGVRLVNNAPNGSNFSNNTWTTFGKPDNDQDSSTFRIDRAFLTTKLGISDLTVGRQALKLDANDLLMDSGAYSFDGVKSAVKLNKKVTVTSNYGRLASGVTFLNSKKVDISAAGAYYENYKNIDVTSLGINYADKNFNGGITYAQLKNYSSDLDLKKWVAVNAGYLVNPKLSVAAEYVTNSADPVSTVVTGGDNAWYAKVLYGDQALKKEGQQNVALKYYDVGANSIVPAFFGPDPLTRNGNGHDFKGLGLDYNYAFSPTFGGELNYYKIDDKVTSTNSSYHYYRAALHVKF